MGVSPETTYWKSFGQEINQLAEVELQLLAPLSLPVQPLESLQQLLPEFPNRELLVRTTTVRFASRR